jgi:Flp pilus assembly protein TadG
MKGNSPMGTGARKRRLRLSSRGQSAVEFALVLPIFLVIVFAIVDFSMALNAKLTVTNAAREGARVLVAGANCSTVTTQAQNVASHLHPPVSVTISPPSCTGNSGDEMAVTVSYQYSYITPVGKFISLLGGGSISNKITMSSTSTMRHE